MGYMHVQEHTDFKLQLLREPTFLSKAVFVGFFVGILGIIVFGSESLFFKVLIGIGAGCLSCLIVDNYEICEFDKKKSEVKLVRLHWCQYMLRKLVSLQDQPYITAKLDDIKDVRVEEQTGPNSGKAYQVILSLETGVLLGVTEVFTTDDISEHEHIAKLIRTFLGDLPPSKSDDEADDEREEVSSSDDDFEQISRTDLEELEGEESVGGPEVTADVDDAAGAAGECGMQAPAKASDSNMSAS